MEWTMCVCADIHPLRNILIFGKYRLPMHWKISMSKNMPPIVPKYMKRLPNSWYIWKCSSIHTPRNRPITIPPNNRFIGFSQVDTISIVSINMRLSKIDSMKSFTFNHLESIIWLSVEFWYSSPKVLSLYEATSHFYWYIQGSSEWRNSLFG